MSAPVNADLERTNKANEVRQGVLRGLGKWGTVL
jgi:hypothetical protein